MVLAMWILAWRPFLEPLPWDAYWLWLLPPLVLGIALVYKAIKLDDLARLPRAALWLSVQVLFFMMLTAAGLWIITRLSEIV